MDKVVGPREGRRAQSTLRPANETPLLTVIVPVYNEVQTIDELLRRVVAAPYAKQVIVVDDGSTDGTAEVLEKWEGHPQVEFCPEATAKACRPGLMISEVPISYDAGSVQAGKKIRWTDGLAALAALWRRRDWRCKRGSGPFQPARLGLGEGSAGRRRVR